jgi:uncharacterized YigZ family protein
VDQIIDTYRTIEAPSKGLFKDRGSRFIALAYPVKSVEEVKPILDSLRKEYHDARHHCYAYMLGAERIVWRANDDGEPSGSAGRPILGQINSAEITDILIVVIRYFGGTLLGVSGLINAYRTAAADALAGSTIVERRVCTILHIKFPYIAMNDVMRILKEEEAGQSGQNFDSGCEMNISFPASQGERIRSRLLKISGVIIEDKR